MFAAASSSAGSFNWYDVLVAIALIYGMWSGVRTGLTGELIRGAGWIATVVVGLHFYQPFGQWFAETFQTALEFGHLMAFGSIIAGMYFLQLGIRALVHKRVKRFKFGAVLENLGGGVAGGVRMILVMVCLSVFLCLVRSPFWHQQVGKDSQFGSYVVSRFPAVAAMLKKKFPEKLWFSEDLKRRDDPDIPDDKPKKK
jgi:uncharacterized membrane protein required for colicin V production